MSSFCQFCGGAMEARFPEPRCWKCDRSATFPHVRHHQDPATQLERLAAQQSGPLDNRKALAGNTPAQV